MRRFHKVFNELKQIVATHTPGKTLSPPPSLESIQVHGRRIYYASMGIERARHEKTPAVVFLHGFGGFFMDWPRVMVPVSQHTHVYAPDLPGWGFSDLNADARNLEDQAGAVREFITKMQLGPVIVCGVSFGAGIAWALAALGCPGLERVVLLNPMPPHPMEFIISPLYQGVFALNATRATAVVAHKMFRKKEWKMLCKENLLNDRLLDTVYLDIAFAVIKQPKIPFLLHAISQGARATDWSEWEHQLSGLNVATSILQGENDRVFSLAAATHLNELIPHSELIKIADCGHAMGFDQHKRVSDFLIASLAREAKPIRFAQSG